MLNKNFKKGFTLVEVLVVVLMLGILAAMATVGYFTTLEASRAREATNILRHWQAARAIYFAEKDTIPDTDPAATLDKLQIGANITNNKYFTCTPQTSSILCRRNENNGYAIVATDTKLYCCWNATSAASVCKNLSHETNTTQVNGIPSGYTCLEIVE